MFERLSRHAHAIIMTSCYYTHLDQYFVFCSQQQTHINNNGGKYFIIRFQKARQCGRKSELTNIPMAWVTDVKTAEQIMIMWVMIQQPDKNGHESQYDWLLD